MVIEKEALRIEEAAYALGISRVKVFGLLKEGRLRRVKIGRRTVIPRSEIARLLGNAPAGRQPDAPEAA